MRRLLRHPGVGLYILGQTLSSVGDSSLWLAAAIWVKEVSGSASAAGLVMFFFGISALFSPLVGVLVDRVRRLPLVIVANLLGIPLVLPLLFVDGPAAVWVVFAVMVGYGFLNRIVNSAQSALLVSIVADDLLASANGVIRSIQESMRIIVPLFGAGLYAWQGIRAVVLLDVVTFLGAVGVFALLRIDEARPVRPDQRTSLWTEAMAGLHYLFGRRVLRAVIGGGAVAALVFGFSESGLFAVVTEGLGRSASFVGVTSAVQGVGAIAVGLFAGALARRVGEVWLVVLGLLGYAMASVLLAVPVLGVVVVAMFFAGLALPLASIGAITCLQRATPPQLQGRVYAGADMLFSTATTMSVALGSGLLAVVGYRWLFVLAAAVLVVAALVALTGRDDVIEVAEMAEPTRPVAGPSATAS